MPVEVRQKRQGTAGRRHRKINDAGRHASITDAPYTVVPDPSWPADSVIIIDTATDKVIESFRVDLSGNPLR